MKSLNRFFDFGKFAIGKTFMVVTTSDWLDYNNKKTKDVIGTVVSVVITRDATDYGNGQTEDNLYEKINIKVTKQITVTPETFILPVNPSCIVWGKYNENLSVTCDDIRIIEPNKGQK